MYDQVVKCQRAGLCLSEHFLICLFFRDILTQKLLLIIMQTSGSMLFHLSEVVQHTVPET